MTAKKARRPVRRIPKGRRASVHRDEFNNLVELLNDRAELLNHVVRDQEIQFQRIAQMQVEIDGMKRSLGRSKQKNGE